LDTPKDPLNTGWYEIYDRPGFGGQRGVLRPRRLLPEHQRSLL
jgi:hypothetical protein